MPARTKDPFRGFCFPDYHGGSLVNLLASVIRSRGGRSPHADLRGLPARSLAGARKVVYLVVDGLGEGQLRRFLGSGRGRVFLAAQPRRTITTVFPATTAAAVTTFGTGASPAEHGVLGWFLHLPDLGLVSTILPATTRTGTPIARDEFDLDRYLDLPSHLDTVKGRKELLSWGHIPTSRYSRTGSRWSGRRAFTTLDGMVRQVAAFARAPGRGLAYAYWPGYDALCHEHGCDHPKTRRHLGEIDRALARLVRELETTGAALVVTADHGLVDTPRRRRVDLRSVPGFYDCLAILPSGDARQVQCFVRPSKVRKFRRIVLQRLGKACVCVPGETLLASGALGPGRCHPALESRVGDFMLLAKKDYAFAAPPAGAKAEFNLANHGGMSRAEMVVPLYVVAADA